MLVLKVLLLCKQPRGNISAGLFEHINESITKRSVDSKLKFKEAVRKHKKEEEYKMQTIPGEWLSFLREQFPSGSHIQLIRMGNDPKTFMSGMTTVIYLR